MPTVPPPARFRAARQFLAALHFYEWWLLGMLAAAHALFWGKGLGGMVWAFGVTWSVIWPLALVAVPGGMVLVAAWEGWSRRSWAGVGECLRLWRTPRWWGGTVRVWLAVFLTTHVYIWLKLQVPLLNGLLLDEWVWRMEERLFFGYSPNRFLLELFRQPFALRAVDWSYARVFQAGIFASLFIFPALRSERLRTACITSYAVLWTIGGWLHVLLPALGPCYYFPSVWMSHAEWLRNSIDSQAALLKNYRELTLYRLSGEIRINPLYGVAAIPSMHNASQALLAMWAARWSRPAGLLAWGSVALIFLGSVITGWHYLVDGVMGILLAGGVYVVLRRTLLPRPEGGTPPTPGAPAD